MRKFVTMMDLRLVLILLIVASAGGAMKVIVDKILMFGRIHGYRVRNQGLIKVYFPFSLLLEL